MITRQKGGSPEYENNDVCKERVILKEQLVEELVKFNKLHDRYENGEEDLASILDQLKEKMQAKKQVIINSSPDLQATVAGKKLDDLFAREKQPSLRAQHERIMELYKEAGVITLLPDGRYGISAEDSETGEAYPAPSYEEIIALYAGSSPEAQALLDLKIEQGFSLAIVPFGMKVTRLSFKCGATHVKAFHDQLLYTGDGQQIRSSDSSKKPYINLKEPIWMSDAYMENEITYYPQVKRTGKANDPYAFVEGSGYTKKEILAGKKADGTPVPEEYLCTFPGWNVRFVEKDTRIPRSGQGGDAKAGRARIETNPKTYWGEYYWMFQAASDPTHPDHATYKQYLGEQGHTLETWFAEALTNRDEDNHLKVMSDYASGTDSEALLTGMNISNSVSCIYWNRNSGRTFVNEYDLHGQVVNSGPRSSVTLR